ncbi:hypothetical protein RB597_000235 [Gaeumannomyces tritici]
MERYGAARRRSSTSHFSYPAVRAYQPITANHGPEAYEVRAETTLVAHDIAIPYPGTLGEGDDVFRFMLVSPDDAGDADTDARLDRLYNLGAHVGVVFLSQDEGCNGFTEFQIRNTHTRPEMTVIPVSIPERLPETMAAFSEGLPQPPPRVPRLWVVKTLLPFCSTNLPLGEHTVNVLSDICPSFRDLVDIMSCEEGHDSIRSYIDEPDAGALIQFFSGEFVS